MPLLEKIYQLLSAPAYQPLNLKALARKLKINSAQQQEFEKILEEEIGKGKLVKIREGLFVLPERVGLVAGKLQMNQRGFGFLLPDHYDGPDIFIGAEETGTAFHGDRVMVRLNEPVTIRRRSPRGFQNNRRVSGQVIKVLQRARRQLVGTLQRSNLFYYVAPDETRIPQDIYVPEPKPPVPVGYKVVVQLTDWPSRHVHPEGIVTEVLGPADQPGVDLLSIIKKFELPEAFPADVEAEDQAISTVIPQSEIARRQDFRSHFTITVDPDDAKDFDDALSFIQHQNGDFEVFVHIADVSTYVRPGTALDREALLRGNSVYLVDRVIPMLPEKLSNGICSLQPDVERLVKTAAVKLNRQGKMVSYRFFSGIIRSRKRLTYHQTFELLQRPQEDEVSRQLAALAKMARILRKNRFANGALDLDFPEFKVRLDETGRPKNIERLENDESHQLIEEFMLLANEAVAEYLKNSQRPAIYRIHEDPDPTRLNDFRTQARGLGFKVGDLTQRGEIQKLLQQVKGKPEEPVIKVNLLKSLRRAIYSPQPIGHYGLAKTNYTHFTSPIRRYADLMVHRAIFSGKGDPNAEQKSGNFKKNKKAIIDVGELAVIAQQLTQCEKNAAEAEQESVKLKKLEYFAGLANQPNKPTFKALILEVKSFGLLVELPEFQMQGLIAVSDIQGDVFVFNNQRLEMRGQRSKIIYRAGEAIPVRVVKVDLMKRQINFSTRKESTFLRS